MSKHRTRAHKIQVFQKKQELSSQSPTNTEDRLLRETRHDLTRSLVLTILALILQMSLKVIIERR